MQHLKLLPLLLSAFLYGCGGGSGSEFSNTQNDYSNTDSISQLEGTQTDYINQEEDKEALVREYPENKYFLEYKSQTTSSYEDIEFDENLSYLDEMLVRQYSSDEDTQNLFRSITELAPLTSSYVDDYRNINSDRPNFIRDLKYYDYTR